MNRRKFVAALGSVATVTGIAKPARAEAHSAEKRLRELGIVLPDPAGPVAVYVPFRKSGNQVFIAGQIPPLDADVPTVGKVGKELSVEQGYAAARLVGLKILAQLRVACDGDLDRVVQAIQIRGFVNCTADFTAQPTVINGVSELFRDVFGEAGLAARAALGINALPLNAAVEVESIFEVRG
ncbi:MAG: RidA family protein [Gammaproteobacteria bacterium]|nr:RidA family protein [Gammaproteobacteria bacterium]MDH4315308.1 RidA family protein [Gammaproteobacteria bacterium]MDH5213423.1 RidA family protein [Gammaproteobacteria bacterium]